MTWIIKLIAGSSIYVKVGIAIALLAASLFAYHKIVVAVQAETIAEQQKQITTLTQNNVTLKANVDAVISANATMNSQIDRLLIQSEGLVTLIKEREVRERELDAKVDELRSSYMSQDEISRLIEAAHKDTAAVVNEVNGTIDCMLSNMGKFDACTKEPKK